MTPQSLRSPVSPYKNHSKQHSFSAQGPSYPPTPQSESATAQQAQTRGLGIMECPVSQEMPPSPQPSGSWSSSSLMEPEYQTSSQPPDIFTAAFDPFSGFSNNSNTGMISGHSPEAPPLVYCQSPTNSNMQSHRSSISSSTYSPSDSFSPNGSDFLLAPKVKVEESSDWYPAMEHGVVTSGIAPYPQALSPAHTDDVYPAHHGDWTRSDTPGYPISLHDGDGPRLAGGPPVLQSVTRTKKKRQRTTPEEATHECRVCGKLFKRSYNWKSHMETHNPERRYPHPCTAMIGTTQCTKKFQRKTDLDRHNDSVHLKAKNHQCQLCGNRFARRDTLRRHTEDGCPKRFELGFREGTAVSPARWSLTNNPTPRNRSFTIGVPQSSPMTPATSFPIYNRSDFVGTAPIMPCGYQ
ncbi:hypothetical protein MMC29_006143 [Sticta canariensis]|nr:hypothetical protein [Sticta canariensis]